MANNKEEAGKGTPRPGEAPGSKRTYATIDLTASEVEGEDRPAAAAAGAAASATSASSSAEARSQAKPEAKPGETKPAESQPKNAARPGLSDGGNAGSAPSSIAARALAAPWLSHLAAGALGAIVVLIVMQLMTTDRPPTQSQEVGDLMRPFYLEYLRKHHVKPR